MKRKAIVIFIPNVFFLKIKVMNGFMIYSLDQLDGEKFDVIVSLKAMHHIPDPLQCVQMLVWNDVFLFDQQKEYLNPKGSIILADLKLDE